MPRKKAKTLHDITGMKMADPKLAVPHIFHDKGQVHTDGMTYIQLDGEAYPISIDALKLYGYSVVAAGHQMVPHKAQYGQRSLRAALREAVATYLATEATDVLERVVRPDFSYKQMQTPYTAAITALRHHQAANGKDILQYAQKFLRGNGYRLQAKMLPSLFDTALDIALTGSRAELEEFYQQFHLLYGTETKQWPEKPGEIRVEVDGDADPDPDLIPTEPNPFDTNRGKQKLWGNMRHIQIPLKPWKHPTIRTARSWKYSEFGTFKYPWRALPSSDMRCFSLQRRQYGGTILLDMSGSMGVQNEQISKLLHLAPYATIAGYGSEIGHVNSGVLVIMAADSMKGDTEDARQRVGSGNVVDGQALRWLAKQSSPRIWVSDGQVTGVGEGQGTWLHEDVARITRAANIKRVQSIESLIQLLYD